MKREAWRELNFRQKLQWVFQYYGVAIVVGIVALIAAASFLGAVLGPGERCAVKVMILDDRQTADNCQRFAEELEAALGGTCEVTCYAPSAMYEMQAFAVRLTSDELDVIIAPGAQMDELQANGYLPSSQELERSSRYQRATRGSEADGEQMRIGIAGRTKNRDAAARAQDYFMEMQP